MQCKLMSHSNKNLTDKVKGWREERKKDWRGGEVVQGLWCCRTPEEWRRILKACTGTTAAGQQRKQMWQDLHLLPTSDCSYALISQQCLALISFLPPLLWHLPLTQMSLPTFALPGVSAGPPPLPPHMLPTLHHPLQLDPHVQPELRCFNPLIVLPSSSHSQWDAECELLGAPSSSFTQPYTSATVKIFSRSRPLFSFNHVFGDWNALM